MYIQYALCSSLLVGHLNNVKLTRAATAQMFHVTEKWCLNTPVFSSVILQVSLMDTLSF